MKKILVLGALGQIGSELTIALRGIYGENNVIASDRVSPQKEKTEEGPFEIIDCTNGELTNNAVKKHNVNVIYNLPSLLSANAERYPQKAFEVNLIGLFKTLEVARENSCAVFTPSTIGVFGESAPKDNTPQETILRPKTMYGVTKVSGELLADYYHHKYGLDTRGLRYPGIISHKTLPGGGTTDYAVEIFFHALKYGKYTSYLKAGTFTDMMYMPDAIRATIELMESNGSELRFRNTYNVTAMSFDIQTLANEIKKHIPAFKLSYEIDPVRQQIADSWPNKIDDSAAKNDWNWKAKYGIREMVEDIIQNVKEKNRNGKIK